jgi:hypothetical protein
MDADIAISNLMIMRDQLESREDNRAVLAFLHREDGETEEDFTVRVSKSRFVAVAQMHRAILDAVRYDMPEIVTLLERVLYQLNLRFPETNGREVFINAAHAQLERFQARNPH